MSDQIEIKVTVNGREVPLGAISTETFEKIRKADGEKYVRYCEENPFYGRSITPTVIEYSGDRLVKVPLPDANTDRTFAAFHWVEGFCKHFQDMKVYGVYPVHGEYAPDNKAIYIHIPEK